MPGEAGQRRAGTVSGLAAGLRRGGKLPWPARHCCALSSPPLPPFSFTCSSFAFITFSMPEGVQKMLDEHACQPLTLDDKQVCAVWLVWASTKGD